MSTPATAAARPMASADQEVLVSQAARSVKWSLLYNIAPRVVTPFSTLILAAILTPADFGLVAVSTLVIALARILIDMGLGKAVIQRQQGVEEAASSGLWLSLLMSAGLYAMLWFASPWISLAYHNHDVTSVVRVAALFLPLAASASIPTALLQRRMEFRRLFWVHTSFLVTQAVASVALALAGAGYWALIFGQLIGMGASAGLAWCQVRWRPTFVLDKSLLRSLLGFSIWIMISGFQNWLLLYADNAIAGLFLGLKGLGIYSLGFSVSTLIPGFFIAALGDVAYPTFCRLQETPGVVGQSLLKLQTLTAAVLFPVAFGVSAVAGPAVRLLYGDKWQGLGAVIGLLVIMPGLTYMWSLNEKAYQGVGRPDIASKLSAAVLLMLLPVLWVAAPHGLHVFTLVRFAGAASIPVLNILVGTRVLHLRIGEQLRALASPFLLAAVMFAFLSGSIRLLSPFQGPAGWLKLLSAAGLGAAVYLLLLRQTNRRLWDQLVLGMRRIIAWGT